MEPYKNLGRNSGIHSFELQDDQITVFFSDRTQYVYTMRSVGSENLETMKQLAVDGQGLNSYIMRQVRKSYESKGSW